MAKSNDEKEFLKSLRGVLRLAFIWKPPDMGRPSPERKYELPRPGDILFQWRSPDGPIGGLIELKRFDKKTLNISDLRPIQYASLKCINENGGFAVIGVHYLTNNNFYMIPFDALDEDEAVNILKYPPCQRVKLSEKAGLGWDLRPLAMMMSAKALENKC